MITLILLCSHECRMSWCSPVCARIMSVSCSIVQFHLVLLLYLCLILHSLNAMSVLPSILDALIDVPNINCFKLESLCLAVCTTSSSSLICGRKVELV